MSTSRALPADLTGQLRARGYRLTPARQLVLAAVATLEHATPDAICAEVQRTASSVNLSTVYRTLELLEELDLVSHTHLGHGAPIYHAAHERDHLLRLLQVQQRSAARTWRGFSISATGSEARSSQPRATAISGGRGCWRADGTNAC